MQTKYLVTNDGVPLMHRSVQALDAGTKTLFACHSQATHTLNLNDFFAGMAAKGWSVHATDLRGHGYSSGNRAPLAHMEPGRGWDDLIADIRLGMQTAFKDVPFEERLIFAPNISALLTLEVLKTWPDLAKRIVLVSPPPNQPTLLKLARSFTKARAMFNAYDKPDELTMHQLYTFLGAHLKDRTRLIDVVSADKALTDALIEDQYAWPTPTTGYFQEMFRGIEQAWHWPKEKRVADGTEILILYGDQDPMTVNGNFIAPMREHLMGIGAAKVDSYCVPDARTGLFSEEKRLGISTIIDDWARGVNLVSTPSSNADFADISSDVLADLGLKDIDRELAADELVELCYNAIDDESRWIEMLYRVAYAIASDSNLDERNLEAIVMALMPHADRSYKLNRQIMQSAAIGAVLQNVIDRFNMGIAVVGNDLEISYANTLFMESFAKLSGQIFEDADDFSALSQTLRELTEDDFQNRCVQGSGDALLMIDGEAVGFHFRPKALRQTALQRGGASGVLILRGNRDNKERPVEEMVELLQFAYGLTVKEAEAALGLLDGLSPDAIAKRFDVSINTTRTHLKRLYEKVGVQGQTELTSKLLKGFIGLIATN